MGVQMRNCAVILLAAGKSARLGSPKQLLVHEGETLLHRSAQAALSTGFTPVYVVLGAAREQLGKELESMPVAIVENEGWEEGMASSIRKGLERMAQDSPEADGALFMVCDQPRVTPSLLNAIMDRQTEQGRPIVASHYGEVIGTPAVFHRSMFPRLMELTGDRGAGKLIAAMPDDVSTVEFPEGMDDIDTREDYDRLTKH